MYVEFKSFCSYTLYFLTVLLASSRSKRVEGLRFLNRYYNTCWQKTTAPKNKQYYKSYKRDNPSISISTSFHISKHDHKVCRFYYIHPHSHHIPRFQNHNHVHELFQFSAKCSCGLHASAP